MVGGGHNKPLPLACCSILKAGRSLLLFFFSWSFPALDARNKLRQIIVATSPSAVKRKTLDIPPRMEFQRYLYRNVIPPLDWPNRPAEKVDFIFSLLLERCKKPDTSLSQKSAHGPHSVLIPVHEAEGVSLACARQRNLSLNHALGAAATLVLHTPEI